MKPFLSKGGAIDQEWFSEAYSREKSRAALDGGNAASSSLRSSLLFFQVYPQLGFDKVGNSFKIIMLPYFVTVTLLIAQASADANILVRIFF